MEDIDSGLAALALEIQSRKIRSIAIPPLGCGLGGLDWSLVRPRIEAALERFSEVRIVLFEPGDAPAAKPTYRSKEVPQMTAGRAALVGLMDRYLRGLLDPFITLLEVHKLMYFLQMAGEPLRLRYVKGPFGPYAENLRHVLAAIEGHLVVGHADGGDAPDKQLALVPGACDDAGAFLKDKTETRARMERVATLVDGFETPFGLELLSTIHWIVQENSARTLDDVVTQTYAWNDRKKQFTPRQIRLAVDVLIEKGWIAGEIAASGIA
jgi:hypothetical protein